MILAHVHINLFNMNRFIVIVIVVYDWFGPGNERMVGNRCNKRHGCQFCNGPHLVSRCHLLRHHQANTGAKDNDGAGRGSYLCSDPHKINRCYKRARSTLYVNGHQAGTHNDNRGQVDAAYYSSLPNVSNSTVRPQVTLYTDIERNLRMHDKHDRYMVLCGGSRHQGYNTCEEWMGPISNNSPLRERTWH